MKVFLIAVPLFLKRFRPETLQNKCRDFNNAIMTEMIHFDEKIKLYFLGGSTGDRKTLTVWRSSARGIHTLLLAISDTDFRHRLIEVTNHITYFEMSTGELTDGSRS